MATLLNTTTKSMSWNSRDQRGYFGILKKSVSSRQNSFETKSLQESPELMRRQEILSFSLACCLCGKRSIAKSDLPSSYTDSNILFQDNAAGLDSNRIASQQQSCWQEGLAMFSGRRKPTSWVQKDETGEEIYYRAPRWKQILRKVRAEARRMNCGGGSPAFQYDPLSYAMNFDDSCCDAHGQNYIHPLRFSNPMALESGKLRTETLYKPGTGIDKVNATWKEPFPTQKLGDPSVWQRRKVSEPPSLDLSKVRIFRPAYRK